MSRHKFQAVFMRGGTSKALMFHARDLPSDRARWDSIFLAAMGSPDPNGRQLNGMGGGVSSVSKVCIIGPPSRADADVDYTFVQVIPREARVDYSGNCGNMSSAVGPFAVDEGLVKVQDGDATIRIHNTNTQKIILSTFRVEEGLSAEHGDFAIPGVGGAGAPIRLDFLSPGGATTGKLLPTGEPVDFIDVEGMGRLSVSMVDAANACVFVSADALGLIGAEMPEQLEGNALLLCRLAAIREQASIAMGITSNIDQARARALVPFVGFVSGPQDAASLNGERIASTDVDLTVRMLSGGQPHRALPLTAALCTAVAAEIPGTIVNRVRRPGAKGTLRIAMPSGVLTVAADVVHGSSGWTTKRGSVFRTARRLFDGFVYA